MKSKVKVIRKVHPCTIILQNRLKQCEVRDKIEYDVLSESIDLNVQGSKGRGYLNTARRRLQKEERVLFDVNRGRGLIRLSNVEKVAEGDKAIKNAEGQQEEVKINSKRLIREN